MATDMDIEMDIDMGLMEGDYTGPEIDIVPDAQISQAPKPILTAPNDNSDSNTLDPAPEKIHLRGLDNFKPEDVKAFAAEHFPEHNPIRVEWIDDTSANLVFESAEIAKSALKAFSAVHVDDPAQIPALQAVPAKSFSQNPQASLEVRCAVIGDRKQAGARERSKFYLFNPEYDPGERRNRGGQRGGNKHRDRDDGGYRSQRYDDREQQSRQESDRLSGFDASLYDDDDDALAQRAARSGRHASSAGGKARSHPRELFPDKTGDRASGRLRDRSASPTREDSAELFRRRKLDTVASANRLKAQVIKSHLKEAEAQRELSAHHRRSDAVDETADLFGTKMLVPMNDGSGDIRNGFSIRGAAKTSQVRGFSIKGASGAQIKELFPSHTGNNSGKELFSERLEGRGGRRQRAEDLFN